MKFLATLALVFVAYAAFAGPCPPSCDCGCQLTGDCVCLVSADDPIPPNKLSAYRVGCDLAKASGKPLCTFVGCKACEVPWATCCEVPTLTGFKTGDIVISVHCANGEHNWCQTVDCVEKIAKRKPVKLQSGEWNVPRWPGPHPGPRPGPHPDPWHDPDHCPDHPDDGSGRHGHFEWDGLMWHFLWDMTATAQLQGGMTCGPNGCGSQGCGQPQGIRYSAPIQFGAFGGFGGGCPGGNCGR